MAKQIADRARKVREGGKNKSKNGEELNMEDDGYQDEKDDIQENGEAEGDKETPKVRRTNKGIKVKRARKKHHLVPFDEEDAKNV